MLQVSENTPDRLVVKTGVRPFHTTTATFDKSTGKARFERTIFFWKRKPIEVPLDDIESITVVQQNMTGAQGMQFSSNNPLVQLKSGQRFWLSDAGSQAGSVQAVQLMRDFLAGTQTDTAAAARVAEQPIVAPHPSRTYRWAAIAVSTLAAVAFLIIGVARVMNFLTLPDCDDETTRKTLNEIFEEKKVKIERLSEVKSLSSTSSERMCQARADIPGGALNLQYRIDWSGWSKRVSITEAEAEAKIDSARLDEVKKAADDFLALARDAHVNGRPPRQSEPTIKALLDKIFDLSEFEGATLAIADVPKAAEWFIAGDRVGTIYILAGTGVNDINKLPNDANVQRRTHRNVADFAPEFARYLDFQVKLAGIMMDVELNRTAKGGKDSLDRPEVNKEVAEARSTLAETLTGDLTTLAYDGVTDDWRRQRLTVMMEVAPKAAKFLSPEQARAVREHALKVATFQRDKLIQDMIKGFADSISP
jgi:hypothetical protein